MIEKLTVAQLLAFLLALAPMGIFLWGLVVITLIKMFKGEL